MTDDLDIEHLPPALADTLSPMLEQVLSDFSSAPVPVLEAEKRPRASTHNRCTP